MSLVRHRSGPDLPLASPLIAHYEAVSHRTVPTEPRVHSGPPLLEACWLAAPPRPCAAYTVVLAAPRRIPSCLCLN